MMACLPANVLMPVQLGTTLWTHRKGTVSLATRRKLWEHLCCSVLLCPSPAWSATCHSRVSFSLTFYEIQTGWFLPVEVTVMLKKLGEGWQGGNPLAQWWGHVACTSWCIEEAWCKSFVIYQADPVLFKYQIPPPESLGSAPGFEPLLLTCLCKAVRGSAAVSSLFIQLPPEGTGNNTCIFLCLQRPSKMLIHACDL